MYPCNICQNCPLHFLFSVDKIGKIYKIDSFGESVAQEISPYFPLQITFINPYILDNDWSIFIEMILMIISQFKPAHFDCIDEEATRVQLEERV